MLKREEFTGQFFMVLNFLLIISHCEIRTFSICINAGSVCIDYIISFFITNLVAKGFWLKIDQKFNTIAETFILASSSFTSC